MDNGFLRGRNPGYRLPAFGLPLALLLACVAGGRAEAAGDRAPNFVVIIADDQAWSGTSVAMIPGVERSRSPTFRMPNLERLAGQGMTFSRAYAAHAKCECSRYSLLFGKTTTSLNTPDKWVTRINARLEDALPNALKRAAPDYRAAVLGKWQLVCAPDKVGYDLSDGITQNEDGISADPDDPKLMFSMTRRAEAFMKEQVDAGHPFYLQLAYYAVHNPAQSLASTLKGYRDVQAPRPELAAMTEDFDTCIGRVLKALDELGIRDRTYVVYMSDNGGRNALLKGSKGNLHEGGLRVPLIVRGPGVASGVYCHEPVVGYDLFPTVLELAAPDSDSPPGLEGGSWKPVLFGIGRGEVKRPIDRFVFHQGDEVDHPQSAIRKGDFKLLYYWDTREAQLFDLSRDIGEQRNLAPERPELAAALEAELKAHVRAGLGDRAVAALERGEVRQGRDGGRPPTGGPRRPGAATK